MASLISKSRYFSKFAKQVRQIDNMYRNQKFPHKSFSAQIQDFREFQIDPRHQIQVPLANECKARRSEYIRASGTSWRGYQSKGHHGEPGSWGPGAGAGAWCFLGFSLQELLSEKQEEEPKEEQQDSELVLMIKRGIVAFHNRDYDKSESLLHVALKSAQELMDEKAVTYIFDVLANLAYQRGHFEKAEVLFKSVLQRHVADGGDLYDNPFVAVSLKLAHCFAAKKDMDNAIMGYHYCIAAQNEKIKAIRENNNSAESPDEDTLVLWAMSMEEYSHFLMGIGRYTQAREHLQEVLQVCKQVHGEAHLQTAVLKNDIGTLYTLEKRYPEAVTELEEAIEIVQHHISAVEEANRVRGADDGKDEAPVKVGAIPNINTENMWSNLAVAHINLGSARLLNGDPHEARRCCREGARLARNAGDAQSKEMAAKCLADVTAAIKRTAQKRKEDIK